MKAVLKILLGVIATLLVGVLAIPFDILPGSAVTAEQELQTRADIMLSAQAHSWAQVAIDGQKAVLSGDAPSAEQQRQALDAVRHAVWRGGVFIGGITAVDYQGLLVSEGPPFVDPFIWIAERQGAALVFSGYAPSENARESIFRLARENFPGLEISGEIEIASGAPPENAWLTAASTSLRALARLDSGAVEANGAQFTLSGAVHDEDRANILRGLMAMLPEGTNGAARLEVLPSPANSSPASEGAESDAAPGKYSALSPQDFADTCRNRLKDIIGGGRIEFSSAGVTIDDASLAQLENLAAAMNDCPQFKLEITGHSDSSGRAAGNEFLSRRRADAVLSVLTDNGVAPRRLRSRGAGEAEPLASNATPEGRRRNRRIEIDLIFAPE